MCAAATGPQMFGILRLLGGLGLGGLIPIAAAIIVEYAPPGKRNIVYAITQSGYAAGGILAASLAIPLIPTAGWRVMYLIAAAPIVLVVPLAVRLLPESLEYLVSRGRIDEARALADRLGVELTIDESLAPRGNWLSSVQTIFDRRYVVGTVLLWLAAFSALLTIYGMNTWLPQIMRQAGFPLGSALSFLLVFNLGSIVGSLVGGRLADLFGSKPVIAGSFLLAAVSIASLSLRPGEVATYILLAIAGYGTIGTQNLLNVYVTRYYPPHARATGIGWALGVGRFGAILGPVIGGAVLASGADLAWNFFIFAAVAVLGLSVVALVPQPSTKEIRHEDLARH